MNIYLDMVGCRLNQSELEKFAHQLRVAGHEIVSRPENADLAIVNTCTVTASAAADSRKLIRRIARAGCPMIFPTGCLATIEPSQIEQIPFVEKIYTNDDKDRLVQNLVVDSGHLVREIKREPLPGKLKRTRAFIKVQDGCDNFCTFCITRVARGKNHSQSMNDIYSDIEYALESGVREIVLTGVNLGSWGLDLDVPTRLSQLISGIIEKLDPPRIRLSSLEPWDVSDDLLDVIAHPSFCAHLHLPLQSGSDDILKSMGRSITTKGYQQVLENIRKIKEGIAITTDLIVGFPGETDSDHVKSITFIKTLQFAGGHVFRYSPRPGTPAENLTHPVPELVKKQRSKELRTVIEGSKNAYAQKFIGGQLDVLWEKSEKDDAGFVLKGISGNYLNVRSHSKLDLYNQISLVKIKSFDGQQMTGQIVT